MFKKSILLCSMILLMILPLQILASETVDKPIKVYTSNNEFLKIDKASDLCMLLEDTKFYGAGVWTDGSFYVHIGEFINIYNKYGEFSLCLICDDSKSGIIKVRAVDNNELEVLSIRSKYLLRINQSGVFIKDSFLSHEEFEQESKAFIDYKPNLIKTKTVALDESNQTIVKIPSYLAIPFIQGSHLRIYTDVQNNDLCIYDDGGLIVLRQFIITIILVGIIGIVLLVKYNARKRSIIKKQISK